MIVLFLFSTFHPDIELCIVSEIVVFDGFGLFLNGFCCGYATTDCFVVIVCIPDHYWYVSSAVIHTVIHCNSMVNVDPHVATRLT